MPILTFLVLIAIAVLVAWLVSASPFPQQVKIAIYVLIAVVILIWVLQSTGVFAWGPMIGPRARQ